MSDGKRVMLGVSFFKNREGAGKTARAFRAVRCRGLQVVLGLETESLREELPADLRERFGGWSEIHLWDGDCTARVLRAWPRNLPLPFYKRYSYGAAANRLQALAKAAGCSHLIRVDPGTWPPEDFAGLVARHMAGADEGLLVSGQYSGRIALRDEFVVRRNRPRYYGLIREFTGIDPRRGRQLTCGAALTVAVGSRPAIAFDGAMAFGSDDGFLQVYFPGQARVDRGSEVGRSAPGYPLSWSEYIRRLANAVILFERHKGNTDRERILGAVRDFLERLKPLAARAFAGEVEGVDPEALPLGEILDGYDNYGRLVASWPEALERLCGFREQVADESREW